MEGIKGLYTGGGLWVPTPIRVDKLGNLLSSPGLPRYTEQARRGTGWQVISTAAVAAVVVRPSATAAVEIWNGEQGGGYSYVVDRAFAWNLVATAVNSNAVMWAMVTKAKAAPANTLAPIGLSGKVYGGKALVAVGTTVTDNGWYPIGPNYIASNAAAPGGGWEALIEGRIIVPPQCSLCLHVSGSIVGDTYTQGAAWYEELLDLM